MLHFGWLTLIINCGTGFVTAVVNAVILRKEINTRKSNNVVFTTNNSKNFSLLSIICGVIFGIFQAVSPFDGVCHISLAIDYVAWFLQGIFMGLYQLDRLHYCFAQNQVYSTKGYPGWLFIIMITFAVIISVIWIIVCFYVYGYNIASCEPTMPGIHFHYRYEDFSATLHYVIVGLYYCYSL